MNENIKFRQKEQLDKIKGALKYATIPLNEYYDFFPKEIKAGLISFKDYDTDIKTAYFSCASKIINTLSAIESHLSTLPSLMIDADRLGDTDTVLLCDQILLAFEELRKSLNTFTVQSEKILMSSSISYSGLLSVLSEFKIKLTNFVEYINSINF